MDITEAIINLGQRVKELYNVVETEEATKHAFIMPFISDVLGYDPFNPLEVVPEYDADVGDRKGLKVDYAIKVGGAVQILMECKKIGTPLRIENAIQLFHYYTPSEARIAILTNGRSYWFYSDTIRPNVMDPEPFLRIDISKMPSRQDIDQLKKIRKESFDLDGVFSSIQHLRYISAIKQFMLGQFREPSREFSNFVSRHIISNESLPFIPRVQFQKFLAEAMNELLDDETKSRMVTTLNDGSDTSDQPDDSTHPALQNNTALDLESSAPKQKRTTNPRPATLDAETQARLNQAIQDHHIPHKPAVETSDSIDLEDETQPAQELTDEQVRLDLANLHSKGLMSQRLQRAQHEDEFPEEVNRTDTDDNF